VARLERHGLIPDQPSDIPRKAGEELLALGYELATQWRQSVSGFTPCLRAGRDVRTGDRHASREKQRRYALPLGATTS
jgi:hypothetical protein